MLVRFVVTRVVARRTDNPATIYAWRKGVEYVGLVIGLLLISRVWFTGSGSFVTYLGLFVSRFGNCTARSNYKFDRMVVYRVPSPV